MKRLKLLLVGTVVVAIGAGLLKYWQYSSLYPSTQDAFVQAHVVTVASQVTGKVSAVHVGENDFVEAGAPLFDIDAADYESAVTQARAQVDAAQQATQSYAEHVSAATVAVQSATTADEVAKAQLARVQTLLENGTVAQATVDQASATAAGTSSDLRAAQAALSEARASEVSNSDTLLTAKSVLTTAERNLARTKVTAPVTGWVANISLREGTVVSAYSALFSMIDNGEWWVEANFKETDLARMKVGQPVSFTVDMMPDAKLSGEITSIGRGSGSTFALLPAENASGNWVKVTQRFTVRITPDAADPDLRAGASANVTVDTTATNQ